MKPAGEMTTPELLEAAAILVAASIPYGSAQGSAAEDVSRELRLRAGAGKEIEDLIYDLGRRDGVPGLQGPIPIVTPLATLRWLVAKSRDGGQST